jgi:uncharacterized protein YprB with RNaseH-like and TPR domain
MAYHLALDLETTSLYANEGIITCYAVVGQDDTIFANVIENEYQERALLIQLMKELWSANLRNPSLKIITYNGSAFDFPMLITRFIQLNLLDDVGRFKKNFDLPTKHLDLYFTARNNILIKSRSLKDVCQYLGIEYKGSDAQPLQLWQERKLENLKSCCIEHAKVLHEIRKKFIELHILERD